MATVFTTILNMSLTASIIILIMLLARFCLKKAPKIYSYLLWSVVLFRLLCPVSLSLPVSVLTPIAEASTFSGASYTTSMEYIPLPENLSKEPTQNPSFDVYSEPNSATGVDESTNAVTMDKQDSPSASKVILTVLGWVWATGVIGILVITVLQTSALRTTLADACVVQGNIFESDKIDTAFVMGVFKPRIYIPVGIPEPIQRAVIIHEQTHRRRGDHIIKILAFFALALHWFNPIVWLAYKLSCEDMEMSCDELSIRRLNMKGYEIESTKNAYGKMLLLLNGGEMLFNSTAFSKNGTKSRIKNLLVNKRNSTAIITVTFVLCVLFAIICVTNPPHNSTGSVVVSNQETGLIFSIDGTNRYGAEVLHFYTSVDDPAQDVPFASVVAYTGNEKNIVIPDTFMDYQVRNIAQDAFKDTAIVSVTIPDSVVCIEMGAFMQCTYLESVSMTDSVYYLGANAFSNCEALSTITLSDNISVLHGNTFFNCASLNSINIPNKLRVINNGAFADCNAEKIFTSINHGNYHNSSTDQSYMFIGGPYLQIEAYGFSNLAGNIHEASEGFGVSDKVITVEISGEIRIIGESAFSGSKNLQTVIIDDGVRAIGADAFRGCTGLEALVIPDSVDTIIDHLGLLDDSFAPISQSLVIYCSEESYAYDWANKHNFTTAPIEDFNKSS